MHSQLTYEVNIRIACLNDVLDQVVSFLLDEYSSSNVSFVWSNDYFIRKLSPVNPAGPGVLFIAEHDCKIIGTLTLVPYIHSDKVIYQIGDTYVSKKHRIVDKINSISSPFDGHNNKFVRRSVFGALVNDAVSYAKKKSIGIFGTPNKNSFPGYTKKLNFYHEPSHDYYAFAFISPKRLKNHSRLIYFFYSSFVFFLYRLVLRVNVNNLLLDEVLNSKCFDSLVVSKEFIRYRFPKEAGYFFLRVSFFFSDHAYLFPARVVYDGASSNSIYLFDDISTEKSLLPPIMFSLVETLFSRLGVDKCYYISSKSLSVIYKLIILYKTNRIPVIFKSFSGNRLKIHHSAYLDIT